jgi:hypothetical protein
MHQTQQAAGQTPGHLFGPPPVHIAFLYGTHYLGETRGHPSNIEVARQKLTRFHNLLEPGPDGARVRNRLPFAGALLICGDIRVHLSDPSW